LGREGVAPEAAIVNKPGINKLATATNLSLIAVLLERVELSEIIPSRLRQQEFRVELAYGP